MGDRKRFAIGAQVRVKNPGVNGVVIELDDKPTALGEYWHKIMTEHGERKEPGCNLQLVPVPITNPAGGKDMPSQQDRQRLLREIEEIQQSMPPRATIRHDTPENHNWFGRVSAGIEKWDPAKSGLVKECLDVFFSNGHARETAYGLTKLLVLLGQAQSDLRLEIAPVSVPSKPSLSAAEVLLKAIYDNTRTGERPIDDVTKLDIGLSEEETIGAFRYLNDKGLIQTFNLPFAARINATGVDAIENQSANREHVGRLSRLQTPSQKMFIGHGRSLVWLQLKTFLTERMHLTCDEFNAEAVAGITTTERLQTLLDDAGFAFLVMTAEDTHADNSTHARENVIHEAGLFQGRLGFRRAIILLEDGCAQFSNIHGLSHIGFPKGNLEPIFEKVRHVLEREQVV